MISALNYYKAHVVVDTYRLMYAVYCNMTHISQKESNVIKQFERLLHALKSL